VGVALTDIPEGNCGNFCVHPGSHMSLLEEFQAQVNIHRVYIALRKMPTLVVPFSHAILSCKKHYAVMPQTDVSIKCIYFLLFAFYSAGPASQYLVFGRSKVG
jgi:hypothetical protein